MKSVARKKQELKPTSQRKPNANIKRAFAKAALFTSALVVAFTFTLKHVFSQSEMEVAKLLAGTDKTIAFTPPSSTSNSNTFDMSKAGDPPKVTGTGSDPNLSEKNPTYTKAPTNAPKIYGEKFCDVKLANDKVVLDNVHINGKIASFGELNIEIKLKDMSNLQIIYMKNVNAVVLRGDHGLCTLKISEENGRIYVEGGGYYIPELVGSIFVKSSDDKILSFPSEKSLFVFENGAWPPVTHAHDGSEFFTHKGAVYEDAVKGILVASTPTTALFSINGIQYPWTFKELTGKEQFPPLEEVFLSSEKGWIRIDSKTMKNGTGEQFKLLVDPETVISEKPTVLMLKVNSEPSPISMR